MLHIQRFTFNVFAENTYLVYDDAGRCLIIDPGCYDSREKQQLSRFIEENDLTPERLVNTHCHTDHVLGNRYVADTYGLSLAGHKDEIPVLQAAAGFGRLMGLEMDPSPEMRIFLDEGDGIDLGDYRFEILFTPGHSPASICLLNKAEKTILSGDVLFEGGIGRTDLPGGNLQVLMESIHSRLLPLADDITVYPGHGPETTIGRERATNPFILAYNAGELRG